jgi:hypothetical protein
MTTIERANQLSDATFSNIEVAFYYLFATPIGWTFWGVLAFLIVWGILSDAADRPAMPKPAQKRSWIVDLYDDDQEHSRK